MYYICRTITSNVFTESLLILQKRLLLKTLFGEKLLNKMATILVIDDNKNNLLTIKAVIENHMSDCRVISTTSPKEGIRLAKKHNPDAILLDILMPEIDGFEVCRILKKDESTNTIPIILLTAILTDTASKIKGLEAGAEAFLTKPIDTFELTAQTKAMLRIKKAEGNLLKKKTDLEKLIVEQKLKLAETNRDYKSLLDNIGEGIGKLDNKNNFVYINKTGAEIFGYSKKDMMNLSLSKVMSNDMVELVLRETKNASPGKSVKFYINITTKTGIGKTLLITAMPEFDLEGKYNGSSGVFRDVTKHLQDEKLLKSALVKANESDQLKNAFLSSISHELRTPLNAVIGFSQILGSNLNHKETNIYANLIFESGIHLQEIVEDIFYFTLVKTGHEKIILEETDLNLLFAEIHKQSLEYQKNYPGKDLKFSVKKIDKNLPRFIVSDKSKLLHILKLLVRNAFKFTLKGSIEIGYSLLDENYIKFFVKDTGIGIPEDKKEVIFEFFRQSDDSLSRQYEGTGIGLAITHKLVEMLSGKIWAESVIDKGSTFYFTLPIKTT